MCSTTQSYLGAYAVPSTLLCQDLGLPSKLCSLPDPPTLRLTALIASYPPGTSLDLPSPQSFPGCLRNRTWSPSTSSFGRGTIISLNHSCLLVSKPVYARPPALEGWARVGSPVCPATCPEWQPPSQIPAEWKCC